MINIYNSSIEIAVIDKPSVKYTGTSSVTQSGRTCQAWASQTPHLHTLGSTDREFPDDSVQEASNYCRDPDYSGALWCFTTDPDVQWEYCKINADGKRHNNIAKTSGYKIKV